MQQSLNSLLVSLVPLQTIGCHAACWAQVLGDLMIYPNRMSFDIMEGGGKAPEPQGLLVVKVKAVSNIKGGGDLFSKVRKVVSALPIRPQAIMIH